MKKSRKCTVHIGTSGWHYKHWRGPFYPDTLPASKMLDFYTRHFDTVEINNSFYRLPAENGLNAWRDSTPPEFCFAAKGSRFLTHMKKLKDPAAGVAKYFERLEILGRKLGPIIFQLPPWWECNLPRLEGFLEVLPASHLYSFEFRNQTWHNDQVYRILKRYNAAFCIYEIAGFHSEFRLTADFTYVRLHGPGAAYQGSYSDEKLQGWATRIESWQNDLDGVYVYFDNDQSAYAVRNSLKLREMAGCRGIECNRTLAAH